MTLPLIMGIVNTTPDSFSDGGQRLDPERAAAYALRLVEEGADIIDIGGESSRPGAQPVSADEERRRVLPVIRALRRQSSVDISIDTVKSSVAAAALDAGATMLNDISAGRHDPEMLPLAAHAKVPICLMHMRGTPQTMQSDVHYDDVVGEVRNFLAESAQRAEQVGVKREHLILDPGIGFGKSPEHNLLLLRELPQLGSLGLPLLVGASRKSFLGKLLDLPLALRFEASLAAAEFAWRGGARIVRVHDVGAHVRYFRALHLFTS